MIPAQVYNARDKKEYDRGIVKVQEGVQAISAMQNPNLDADKLGDLSIEEANFRQLTMELVTANTQIQGLQPQIEV